MSIGILIVRLWESVNYVTEIFKLMMQVALLSIAQKWLVLSLPACIVIVYIVQKVYLRTSRQLRFIELESRAAVFSSFLESVGDNSKFQSISLNLARLKVSKQYGRLAGPKKSYMTISGV